MEFGSAFDGERFYIANANSNNKPWRLKKFGNFEVRAAYWAALDPSTGMAAYAHLPLKFGASVQKKKIKKTKFITLFVLVIVIAIRGRCVFFLKGRFCGNALHQMMA